MGRQWHAGDRGIRPFGLCQRRRGQGDRQSKEGQGRDVHRDISINRYSSGLVHQLQAAALPRQAEIAATFGTNRTKNAGRAA
jgi:hypothetical protein